MWRRLKTQGRQWWPRYPTAGCVQALAVLVVDILGGSCRRFVVPFRVVKWLLVTRATFFPQAVQHNNAWERAGPRLLFLNTPCAVESFDEFPSLRALPSSASSSSAGRPAESHDMLGITEKFNGPVRVSLTFSYEPSSLLPITFKRACFTYVRPAYSYRFLGTMSFIMSEISCYALLTASVAASASKTTTVT